MRLRQFTCSIFLILGSLFSVFSFAQQLSITIHGIVVDAYGETIPGVSVYVKGSTVGTISDLNGNFEIPVPSQNSVLVFSCLGFDSMEETVGTQRVIKMTLKESSVDLDEVVVVGYGTVRKKDLTGSVSHIKGSDMANMPVSNPVEALGAKVPGLSISNNSGRPGGDMAINLRGFNSINASNSPLFVVDGVIGAGLQSINPSDIESVDVLKDASATAIYGSQASNGVIIVTTKRPQTGDFNVTINTNMKLTTMANALDMLDANGYMEYLKRSWEYDPRRGAFPTGELHSFYPNLFTTDGKPIYNTDWQKESSRNAVSNSTYVSILGGTEKSKQGLYLGYIDDKGVLNNTYYRKYSIRYTNDLKLYNWLEVGGSISYNYNKKNQVDDYRVGAMTATRLLPGMIPILPVQYEDGSHSTMQDFGIGYSYDSDGNFVGSYPTGIYTANNPVQLLNDLVYYRTEHQMLTNLYATINITNDLEFKTTFGAQLFDKNDQLYASRNLLDIGKSVGGRASINYEKSLYWQSESFLSYKKLIGNHRINAILGASWTEMTRDGFSAGATGFSTDYFQYNNLAAGSDPTTPTSFYNRERMNSYYARVNYTFKDRYLLTATGRADGSSKFGSGNKYAFFPSVAVGWNVSEEDFMEKFDRLSNLKLRTSFGTTGNSGISPYSSLGTLDNSTTVYLDGKRYVGTTMGNIPNPDLKWEQTAQYNVGVDLGLFNNRLSVTADYYYKKTTNLLLNNPMSYVSGYASVNENIGSVRNTGFEASVNGTVIDTKEWTVTLGGSISRNRNKILSLGETDADILPGRVPGGLIYNVLRVGGSVGDLIGYNRIGTWGSHEADEAAKYGRKPGDIKREDINKDYKYDDKDVAILGNIFPKYELYFNLGVRYKNWDLSTDIQVKQGNKQVNATSFELEDRQFYLSSYASLIQDAWTPENQNTMIPAIRTQSDALFSDSPSGYIDSHFVEDGSFIRGKNITLGYTFTENQLSRIRLKGLKIYANAQNYFLITNYRGYDPEISTVSASTFSQGVDYFGYPNSRSYSLGLTVTF